MQSSDRSLSHRRYRALLCDQHSSTINVRQKPRGSLYKISTDVKPIPRTTVPQLPPSNILACPEKMGHAAKPAQHPANVRPRSPPTPPPSIEGINAPVHKAVTWGFTIPSYYLPKFDPTYPSRP